MISRRPWSSLTAASARAEKVEKAMVPPARRRRRRPCGKHVMHGAPIDQTLKLTALPFRHSIADDRVPRTYRYCARPADVRHGELHADLVPRCYLIDALLDHGERHWVEPIGQRG